MKFFSVAKDGGQDSPVTGYFLVEVKTLFSIVLLHFGGTREAYHSHAFNALTLWLWGTVEERVITDDNETSRVWSAGQLKYTPRSCVHKVIPKGSAWALSLRGPWVDTWKEFWPQLKRVVTLTHGRRIVQ